MEMNLGLSLKTLALIAFVLASTTAIVKAGHPADSATAMALASAGGFPLPASTH
jgi:hypothetical protein